MKKSKFIILLLLSLFLMSSVSASLPKKAKGGIEFSYENPSAEAVFLVGEFNNWDITKTPMKKDDKGIWRVTIKFDRGVYQYKFYFDGQYIQDPDNPDSQPDPYGGKNSTITVDKYGNVTRTTKKEEIISNTPLNSKVYIGGLYYGKYSWQPDSSDYDRWRLGSPIHNINIFFKSQINENITLKTTMAINNNVEGVDLWKSHLRFFNSYLKFSAKKFDLITFDNYEVVQFNDPAGLFGNVGIFNHPFGRNTRGIVFQTYPFTTDVTFIYGDAIGIDASEYYSPGMAKLYSQYTDFIGLRLQKKITSFLLLGFSGRMDRGFDNKTVRSPDLENINYEIYSVNSTYAVDLEFFKDFGDSSNQLKTTIEYLTGNDLVQATSMDKDITGEYEDTKLNWETRKTTSIILGVSLTLRKYFRTEFEFESINTTLSPEGVYFATFDSSFDELNSKINKQKLNITYQLNLRKLTLYFGVGINLKTFDWADKMLWDLNEQLIYRPPFFTPVPYSEFIWLGYDKYVFYTPSIKLKTVDNRLILSLDSKISAYDIGYEPRSMENIVKVYFYFTPSQKFGIFANVRNMSYSDKDGLLGFDETFTAVYGGFRYQLGKNIKTEIVWGNSTSLAPIYKNSLIYHDSDPYNREHYLITNGPNYNDLSNVNYFKTQFAEDLYNAEKGLSEKKEIAVKAVIEF